MEKLKVFKRRSKWFIYPTFQKKFMILLFFFCFFIFGIIFFLDYILAQSKFTFLFQALFILASLFFLALYLSHKIAGPIVRIISYVRELEKDILMHKNDKTYELRPIEFRKNDLFPEVASSINRLIDILLNK